MPFITLAIDGGLNLVTPPVSVAPGRIQDCNNFEVALNQGLKSVDGIERFDGGPSPSAGVFNGWSVPVTGNTIGITHLVDLDFVGGTIEFNCYNEKTGDFFTLACPINYSIGLTATTGVIYFSTANASDSLILGDILAGGLNGNIFNNNNPAAYSFDGVDAAIFVQGTVVPSSAFATVQDNLTSQAAAYALIRTQVQEVPGQGNVLGLFWLKDELYACRDYFTLAYDASTSTPDYDDELFIGASYAAATWKGFLAKNVVTSSDSSTGVAAGLMMFYNTTGTATLATLYNHTQGDIAVATVTSLDAGALGAGLYRADGFRGSTVATQSWTHQNLGYYVRYKDGAADFVPANRIAPQTPYASLITSTDWVVADAQISTGAWVPMGSSAPASIWQAVQTVDEDVSYACKGFASNVLSAAFWVNSFGLTDTDIPAGSTITGFTIEVERRAYRPVAVNAGANLQDGILELKWAADSGVGGVGNFGNPVLNWVASASLPDSAIPPYVTITYGGAQSLLGYTNIGPEDVKASDFGFRMSVKCTGYSAPGGAASPDGANSISAHVSAVRAKVHFVPPQSKIYYWNVNAAAPTAVVAEVVTSYLTSGSVATTDAKGHLFLMNLGTNRAVGADEEIRTYPAPGVTPDGGVADGSSLIARTETSVTKNVMDWSALLSGQGKKPNQSKYQYDTSNFYAAADFDAIYGVSGAGPAFMYDGYAFTRIYTGTPEQDDIPRHVRVHQSRLFLGYKSGSVQWSVAGDPLSFDPLNFAGEIGVGAAVRGLIELNGDTLAQLTQKGVSMIQGDVGLSPYPGIISPDVGCVEYSAQSMGQFMYTSFRGIQNLRATQAYGDFDTSQFSRDVWSWLNPRVQTSAFFESANIGVINSLAVRNKSQYRLMFADGKQLTATFLRQGEMPQYTIQTYYHADAVTPLTWDVVTAGVETNGRDRLFGATNDGTGYVYEIDRGYSFDGAAITGFAELVVMDQGAPQQKKEYTDLQVHGIATGYASFNTSRATNYGQPDPSINYANVFGSLTAAPTGSEAYFSSAVPIRNFGRNLTLRFDRSSNSEPPVTLQAVSYNIESAGDKRT